MAQPEHDLDILLAEDTATDAEITMRALRKCGFARNIAWVKDGQGVMDFLCRTGPYAGSSQARPRLIILDIKMPKLSGIEVLREIKANSALRSIPVVMLTSSAEEVDMAKSYDLGVNSYIVKPVDFVKLSEMVSGAGLYWLLTNRLPESWPRLSAPSTASSG